jgi:hypothetical protein
MSFSSSRNNFTALDNLGLNDSLGIQFSGRTSAPTDADLAVGRLFFNSTEGKLQVYNGTNWASLMTVAPSGQTTATYLSLSDSTLTTGSLASFVSGSTSSGVRSLLYVENTSSTATGCVPLSLKQGAPTSTNYYKLTTYVTSAGTVTLWMGKGITANGTLSGTAGDILFNGGSNKPEYCTGGTTWVALV